MIVSKGNKQGIADAVIYYQFMQSGDFFDDEFKAAVCRAGAQARIETLQAGVSVFYWDSKLNVDVREDPGGRKFAIRYIPGAPGDRNYEVIRELREPAA